MNNLKKNRIEKIKKILDEFFPNPEIPLNHKSSFMLLIAVLLSARCTDVRVNLVTPLLFAKASTPEEMVNLSAEEIQKIIKICGLSLRKAKAIKELCEIILDKHNGCIPETLEELEALPGVGHKTASVVLCQAFGKPAFPVDTHIHRCAQRWGLSCGSSVKRTEEDLKKIFPENEWSKRHLQIIHFARAYCPAKAHSEQRCPICSQL